MITPKLHPNQAIANLIYLDLMRKRPFRGWDVEQYYSLAQEMMKSFKNPAWGHVDESLRKYIIKNKII